MVRVLGGWVCYDHSLPEESADNGTFIPEPAKPDPLVSGQRDILFMLEQLLLQQLIMMRNINVGQDLLGICTKQVGQIQENIKRIHRD